jgi:hypothetical protein
LENLCIVSGDVTYNTLSGFIICPGESLLFRDCKATAQIYITPEFVSPYSFNVGDIIASYVNGNTSVRRCLEFVGSTGSTPTDTIQVVSVYPSGSTACEDCRSSAPSPTPTSTLTPTPTLTPTNTPTPSSIIGTKFHIYRRCGKNPCANDFVVQLTPVLDDFGNNLSQFTQFGFLQYDPLSPRVGDEWQCWEYVGNVIGNSVNSAVTINTLINTIYNVGTLFATVNSCSNVTNNPYLSLFNNYFTDIPSVNGNLLNFGPSGTGYPPNDGVGCCVCCLSGERTVYVYRLCPVNVGAVPEIIFQYIEVLPYGVPLSVGEVFSAKGSYLGIGAFPNPYTQCFEFLGTFQGSISVFNHLLQNGTPPVVNYNTIIFSYPDFFNPPNPPTTTTFISYSSIAGGPTATFPDCVTCNSALGLG